MKLHANAALSLNGAALVSSGCSTQGWTLTKAAEAAEVSDRTARKWVRRYRAEGEAGLPDRSSAPRSVANRTDEQRVEAIAALRRLRMTGARDRRGCLGMPLSTVSGILTRIGLGRLGRLEPPEPRATATSAPAGRTAPRRRQEAGPDPGRRRPPRHGPRDTGTRPAPQAPRRLGVRARLHRRRHPAGLRRGARRREGDHRGRLPPPRDRLLRRPRHPVERVMTDNGSAYRSSSTRSPAERSGSATSAPAPTAAAPTARPSASSAPCSAAGPTARSTPAANATTRSASGSGQYNYRRPHGALSHNPPAARLTS